MSRHAGRAGPPDRARRRPALVLLGALWLLAAAVAVRVVAASADWPAPPALPTVDQVSDARGAALVAGVVVVLPALVGWLLAWRWREDVATVLFLAATMLSVLGAGLAVQLADSPVAG